MARLFNERCSAVRLQASESEARQALQANDRSAVDEASAEVLRSDSGLLLIIVNCTKTNVWCGHINYGPLAQLVSLRRKKVAGGRLFNERCSAVRLQASESEARQALQTNDRSAVDEASAEFYNDSGLLLIIVNCTKTNVWCGHINYGPLAQLVGLRRKGCRWQAF